jgi:hypothetical protein
VHALVSLRLSTAWLSVEPEITLKPLLTPNNWTIVYKKMHIFLHIILHILHIVLHILHIVLHTAAYYLTYSAYSAYCNMQNMQNVNSALIFLHIILYIVHIILHISPSICKIICKLQNQYVE